MTSRPARAGRFALAVAMAVAAIGCAAPAPSPAVHDGPVVLVTLGGVRAEAVGFLGAEPPGLTPHLDALAAEADWAGAAVAPSSVGVVSLASYLTGLGGWSHAVGFGERPLRLPAELRTLAEALGESGYRSCGYVPPWLARADGWRQGFGFLRDVGGGGRAAGHLASLDDSRQMVWIHLSGAEAPWSRHDAFLDRLPPLSPQRLAALPLHLSQAELERRRDPAAGPGSRATVETLYRLAVARVDQQLGELVAALGSGTARDDTLLVVVSTHGQELTEAGGWGLVREHLEVPMVVDLPPRLAAPGGGGLLSEGGRDGRASRPAAAGLWATLVGAVGAAVPPAAVPSLVAAREGALSQLHLGDGFNETSWVEGDLQLLRRVRFAPSGTSFAAVRRARVGLVPPAAGDAAALLAGVERAFATTPAWGGRGAAESLLVAWRRDGTERVEDPGRRAAMASSMDRRRQAFTPCDLTPGEAARRRAAERSAAEDG